MHWLCAHHAAGAILSAGETDSKSEEATGLNRTYKLAGEIITTLNHNQEHSKQMFAKWIAKILGINLWCNTAY